MRNLYYYILSLDYYPHDVVSNNAYKTDISAYKKYMRYLVGRMVAHDTYTEMWAIANRLGDSMPSSWRVYNDGRCQLVMYGDTRIPKWWKGNRDAYTLMDRMP
jgi:hypothetical protein